MQCICKWLKSWQPVRAIRHAPLFPSWYKVDLPNVTLASIQYFTIQFLLYKMTTVAA